ncbi:hypothetical protein, partial [Asanoa sp. NPDC050611]|uniref:hypothetical protein n=1 Tax=Asanoa sp. NPDC050611 TaxID=3157098 RepID=UPI0033E39FF6
MRTARRLLAGVAAAGAFVAASALPAYAAAPNLQIETRDALVAPDGYVSGYAFVFNPDDALNGVISVVVDSSDLKGAHIEWNDMSTEWLCTAESDTVTRCANAGGEFVSGVSLDYVLRGESDAQVGDTGSISFTAEFGGAKATGKSNVTIAEASDLSTGSFEQGPPTLEVTGDPGGTTKANAPVSNVGQSTVERTVLTIQPDWRTPYAGDFSNCVYYDNAFAICEFDQALEPGKNYRLSEDIPYGIDKTVRTGSVLSTYTDWWIADDFKLVEKSWLDLVSESHRGTGEPLRLEEVANARRGPQTDVTPYDSWWEVKITAGGDNQVDMAAIGATASGAVGATVDVAPGIRNLGPAALTSDGVPPAKPDVLITMPEGTTVVEASWDCAPYTAGGDWPPADDADWGKGGAREYGCWVWDLYTGYDYQFAFKVKIDQVLENAVGTITTKIGGDPNAGNDSAEIVVNSAGAGVGGGTGGGDGGGLPVTGPKSTMIAGVGVLMVGAGA